MNSAKTEKYMWREERTRGSACSAEGRMIVPPPQYVLPEHDDEDVHDEQLFVQTHTSKHEIGPECDPDQIDTATEDEHLSDHVLTSFNIPSAVCSACGQMDRLPDSTLCHDCFNENTRGQVWPEAIPPPALFGDVWPAEFQPHEPTGLDPAQNWIRLASRVVQAAEQGQAQHAQVTDAHDQHPEVTPEIAAAHPYLEDVQWPPAEPERRCDGLWTQLDIPKRWIGFWPPDVRNSSAASSSDGTAQVTPTSGVNWNDLIPDVNPHLIPHNYSTSTGLEDYDRMQALMRWGQRQNALQATPAAPSGKRSRLFGPDGCLVHLELPGCRRLCDLCAGECNECLLREGHEGHEGNCNCGEHRPPWT